MNFRGLDMNLLVVLDTLLEEKNITRTSRRIYLSQSGTSEALARLREFFRDDILVQVGNRMVLTPLAETLVHPVHEILRCTQAIIDNRLEFCPAESSRRFRIMMSDYMITILMPKILQRIETLAPNVELEILPLAEKASEQIDRAEIDLLIMPERFLSSTHPFEKVLQDTHACLVWSENRSFGESITVDEYFSATHIGAYYYDRKSCGLDRWLFAQFNKERTIAHISRAQGLLPMLIIGTKHVATIQRKLAEFYAKSLALRIVEPQFEMPSLVELVQWHSTRNDDSGIAWLRDLICEIAKAEFGGSRASGKKSSSPLISKEFSMFLHKELK